MILICTVVFTICSCSYKDTAVTSAFETEPESAPEIDTNDLEYSEPDTYNVFDETDDKNKVLEEDFEKYLIEQPHLNEVVDNIYKSYYLNLDNYTIEAGDDFDKNLITQLDTNYCIPVYHFPYRMDNDQDNVGNSFARLLSEVSQKPFATLLPSEIYYKISVADENGHSIGYAYAHMDEDKENKMVLDFFWNGTTINSFTLKLSKQILQALVESPLDLGSMKTIYADFAGYGGVVFYDDQTALFSPVTDFFTSVCGLDVDKIYPITTAIDAFEKSFADD